MTEQRRIGKAGSFGAAARRPYQLGRRQAAIDATRTRILTAASDLHGELGSTSTTASAVARRAGVTRATLYCHFASQAELLAATTAAWAKRLPGPNFAAWPAIGDPPARLRAGLA